MHRLAALLTVFLATACAAIPEKPCEVPEALVDSASEYRINVGDVISINVFDEQQLGGSFRVQTNGTVSLPIVGATTAQGLTIDEFIQELETRLAEQLLNRPAVNAEITNFQKYYVLGEVARPGAYSYELRTDLYAAVASAGGFSYRANKRCVSLRSSATGEEYRVPMNAQIVLQPADVIIVHPRYF